MNRTISALLGYILCTMQCIYAAPGCLAAYGSLKTVDYKEWRLVQNCTCDCEQSHTIVRGGLCSGCRHRHPMIPINATRNIVDMQTVVHYVNLNQLAQYQKEIASKKE